MSEEKDKNIDKEEEFEVVTGDGKDLNISQVHNHIKIDKPNNQNKKDKKIVIPKSKK